MDDENTQILNFSAKMISDYPEDRRRQFVVSYFLCDKTMQVFEMQVPNSGFRAGKFLQRTRVRNPVTKQFFEPSAFYIGSRLHISGRVFELLDAAPHTFCLMEANSEDFPEADIEHVLTQLGGIIQEEGKDLKQMFAEKDPHQVGKIEIEGAKEILSQFVPKITKHAVFTIARAFDRDGQFEYGPMLNFLHL